MYKLGMEVKTMNQISLVTPVGNFWLESNGKRIPFIVEEQVRYLSEICCKTISKQDIDLAVSITPEVESGTVLNELSLRSDINEEEWCYDDWIAGERLLGMNFLNQKNLVSLAIGLAHNDHFNKNEYNYARGKTSHVTDPMYFVKTAPHSDGIHVPIELSYSEMSADAIKYVKFAIAVKSFKSICELSSDIVGLAVFDIL